MDIQLDGSNFDMVIGVGRGLTVGMEGSSGCYAVVGSGLGQMIGIDVGSELGWVACADVGSWVCN